nr:hypothetical protein [Burkholderia territorii]
MAILDVDVAVASAPTATDFTPDAVAASPSALADVPDASAPWPKALENPADAVLKSPTATESPPVAAAWLPTAVSRVIDEPETPAIEAVPMAVSSVLYDTAAPTPPF